MTTHPILGQVAPVESLGRATLEAIESSGRCSISAELAGINARAMQDAEQRAVDRAVAAGLGASEWRACMAPETPQLPAFGQWLPIESAPKSAFGTRPSYVLIGHETARWVFVGYRHEPNYPDDPEWCDEHGEFVQPQPTHWMPLPLPPTGETP